MGCTRCSLLVKSELENMGICSYSMKAGEVDIHEQIAEEQQIGFKYALTHLGLELIDNKESIIIEKIKTEIDELIFGNSEHTKIRLSEYLSSKLGFSYHYLSGIFTAVHGSSIERYYIRHKIERVKEILNHESLSLNEIAFKLHFSSVSHMSAQFKKETGLTLTQYRQSGHRTRPDPRDR
jgi:AraC-like DNA-binding protein